MSGTGVPAAPTGPGAFSAALAGVTTWDVPAAGVAVVGTSGVLARVGRTGEVLRIASVGKTLVAYVTMIAVQEGAVELDEPAGAPGCTLRHLLSHAAGYGFDSGPITQPGTRRTYSNTDIEVAAAHLGKRSGIAFADYLDQALLTPLAMSSTSLDGSPAYMIRSTVDDLAAFAGELLAPRLLDPTLLAGMVEVQFPGLSGVVPGIGRFDPCDWGIGFERNFARPSPPNPVHWAGTAVSPATFGHFGGAGSFLWVDPTRDLACVCLTGRDFGPWAMQAWPGLCDAVVSAADGTAAGAGLGDVRRDGPVP